jgi:hypothetical protein
LMYLLAVWMESPPDMPPINCIVMSSILVTHPVNWTFRDKFMPVHLLSQTHRCANHTVTAVPQTGFSCTYLQ